MCVCVNQFDVRFPDEYILEADARSRLTQTHSPKTSEPTSTQIQTSSPAPENEYSDLSQQIPLRKDGDEGHRGRSDSMHVNSIESYEEMVSHGQRFLCEIPKVEAQNNTGQSNNSTTDQEKELTRATDRGMELLREMDGRCMYYSAGWWSYSFCYMDQVRQFHALLPGNGVPAYPPVEDPNTHPYVLGKFRGDDENKKQEAAVSRQKLTTEAVVRESRGDSRYLVQYLEDGTICDLTGRPRRIEVQFHCHPQSTDHIGWIKEVTTCSYLMVIHTPRLCNDVAFQPPRQDEAHNVICREVITPEEIPDWEAVGAAAQAEQELLVGNGPTYPVVGDIEVGAMKLVGKDGKRIEKGKVALVGGEKVEVVARSRGGEYHRASKDQLKKMKLDPEEIDIARKELDEYSRGQDWKLEMVDVNGERSLRGVINNGADDNEETETVKKEEGANQEKKKKPHQEDDKGDSDDGTDTTYKEEL